jgi:hypothetical protein
MRSITAALLSTVLVVTAAPAATSAAPATPTTAWRDGRFAVDAAGVVRRANVVLGRANPRPTQAMPLGNGTLGAAVWAADGFTAQLNRTDTFPDRKSPGQLVIPGLAQMTMADDFRGELDRYDATLRESGGGMTMKTYVRADTAQLVVEVTGADPGREQTAQVAAASRPLLPRAPSRRSPRRGPTPPRSATLGARSARSRP